MAQLKQSVAYNRMILMVDSTDHVTGKTGLTLTINASKNGGAFAAITPTVTDRGNGWYNLALTTAHTDTLGDFALRITGTAADPTDISDQIIAQDLMATNVSANVTQWLGTAPATPNTAGIPMVDGRQTVFSGTVASATANTVVLNAGPSTLDDFYNDCMIIITAGTGVDQVRTVYDYTGSTRTITLGKNWVTQPVAGDVFIIYGFARIDVGYVGGVIQTPRDLGGQLDAAISTRQATLTLPVSSNVTQWNSSAVATPNTAGVPVVDDRNNAIRIGIAQAGAAGSITLDAGANASNNYYDDCIVVLTSGTGAGQCRMISSYTGATKVVTVVPNWTTNPVAGTGFTLLPQGRVDIGEVADVLQTTGVDLGTRLDAAISTRMATFTLPTNFSSLAVTAGGAVTAGTVSDKTGYSLTQTFPANFASMSISATGIIASNVTQWNTSAIVTPNTAGVPVVDDRSSFARAGTLQAATGSSATLDAGASAVDGFYVGQLLVSAGQSRRITVYTGATKVATLATAWTTAPGAVAYTLQSQSPTVNVGHVAGTAQTARDLGANLDVAVSSRMATFTLPTNFSSFALTAGGAVTVGTNSDKTGYSLTQAFPTNFGTLSIDVNGRVDISKVLGTTQTARDLGLNIDAAISSRMATFTLPTNFASLAIATTTGRVDVGSVSGTVQTARDIGNLVDVAVSSRLAAASFVAADNTSITAIKTKTDFLPSVTSGSAGGLFIAGTNAPTSVTTAFTANISGSLSGSVGSVTGAVGSVAGNVSGSVNSIADPSSIFNYVIENSRTFAQLVRGMVATLLGKASGMSGTTATFRDDADTKDRVVSTVDNSGNRTSVTKDLT
jgi:hypothetical protein